jgi:hypothetical protein
MPPVLQQLCKHLVVFSQLIRLLFTDAFSALTSLEAAAQTPDSLSQEAIIENLDPVEAERLSRVRNIGIAVCCSFPS